MAMSTLLNLMLTIIIHILETLVFKYILLTEVLVTFIVHVVILVYLENVNTLLLV